MADPAAILGRSLPVVRFRAGGHEMAVEATAIAAMRLAPEPGALAVEDLLGLDRAEAGPRRWLMVRSRDGERCVEVGEPVRLDSLPAESIHPLPALAAARQSLRGVKAVALGQDGLVLVVDLAEAMPAP